MTFAIDQPDENLFDDPVQNFADVLPFATHVITPAVTKVELAHPAHDLVRDALAYHGVPPAFSARIMEHLQHVTLKPDHLLDVAEKALAQALTTAVKFKPLELKAPLPPTRAIMLVGPHGAGKTSTIAKMATELTLQKKPVLLISTDMERLNGAESLQKLAGLLNCGFAISESRANLKAALTAAQGKAWILIDSSGANIYEFSQLKSLGEFASLQGIEPILTCPAGMDSAEAEEMAGVFNFLNMDRMIVTRLDAVRRLGSVFASVATGGYALASLTNSALPTDPCQPLSAAALARLMLRHERARVTH